jgi:hypothetical protein
MKYSALIFSIILISSFSFAYDVCIDYSTEEAPEALAIPVATEELAALFTPDLSEVYVDYNVDEYNVDFDPQINLATLGVPSVLPPGIEPNNEKWETIEIMKNLIANGMIIPLVEGEELAQEALGEYGYYSYLPFNPYQTQNLDVIDPQDLSSLYSGSYGGVMNMVSNISGNSDEFATASTFDFDQHTMELFTTQSEIPSVEFDFNKIDLNNVTAFNQDFMGQTNIPELLKSELLEISSGKCDEAISGIFWTGQRTPLPKYLSVEADHGITCHYFLNKDKNPRGSYYDPFTDIYQTGYLVLKQYSYVDDYAAYAKDQSIEDLELSKAAGSFRNSSWDPSLINRTAIGDGVNSYASVEELKKFSKFFIELVPPVNLPVCNLDGDLAGLKREDSKDKLSFAGGAVFQTGDNIISELTPDETVAIEAAYSKLINLSSNEFEAWWNKLSSDVSDFGMSDLLRPLGSRKAVLSAVNGTGRLVFKGTQSLSAEAIKRITVRTAETARATAMSEMITASVALKKLNPALDPHTYAAAVGRLEDAAGGYYKSTQKLKAAGAKFMEATSSTGGKVIMPVGVVVDGVESLDNVLATQMQAMIAGTGTAAEKKVGGLLSVVSTASSDAVSESTFKSSVSTLVKTADASTINGPALRNVDIAITGNKFWTGQALIGTYTSKAHRAARLRMLSSVVKSGRSNLYASSRINDLGRSAGMNLDELAILRKGGSQADELLLKTTDAAINEEKLYREAMEEVTGRWSLLGKAASGVDDIALAASRGIDNVVLKSSTKFMRVGVGGTLRLGRATARGAIGFARVASGSIIISELAGITLSAATRGICYLNAGGIFAEKNALGSFGYTCGVNGANNKTLDCTLYKTYEIPTFYEEYNQCMSTALADSMQFVADILSFTSETVVGSVIDKAIGTGPNVNAFNDTTRLGVYSYGNASQCKLKFNQKDPKQSKKSYLISSATPGSSGDTKEMLGRYDFNVELTANDGTDCKFFMVSSVRPSADYLNIMTSRPPAKVMSSLSEDTDRVLTPRSYAKLFDEREYVAATMDIVSSGSSKQKSGLASINDSQKLYLRYGFLIKSKDFDYKKGAWEKTTDWVDDVVVAPIKKGVGVVIGKVSGGISNSCEKVDSTVDAAFADACQSVSIVKNKFSNGGLVGDLVFGISNNAGTVVDTSDDTLDIFAAGKDFTEGNNLEGLIGTIDYNAESDTLLIEELELLNYFDFDKLMKGLADNKVKVFYRGNSDDWEKIDELVSLWTASVLKNYTVDKVQVSKEESIKAKKDCVDYLLFMYHVQGDEYQEVAAGEKITDASPGVKSLKITVSDDGGFVFDHDVDKIKFIDEHIGKIDKMGLVYYGDKRDVALKYINTWKSELKDLLVLRGVN